jgi:hypothetical protein
MNEANSRHEVDNPDLAFFLFLARGVKPQKRVEWARDTFPRTMAVLEIARDGLFAPHVRNNARRSPLIEEA